MLVVGVYSVKGICYYRYYFWVLWVRGSNISRIFLGKSYIYGLNLRVGDGLQVVQRLEFIFGMYDSYLKLVV